MRVAGVNEEVDIDSFRGGGWRVVRHTLLDGGDVVEVLG